jgi:hypothetical protein
MKFLKLSTKKDFLLLSFTIILLSNSGFISPLKAETLTIKVMPMIMAKSPLTQMTKKNNDTIAVQIKDAEFVFNGTLKRTSGNMFIGEDKYLCKINNIFFSKMFEYIFYCTS